MNELNFSELKRKVDNTEDLNAKELLLYEARATCQQTFLFAGNTYLMQIESELTYLQKAKELTAPLSLQSDEGHTKKSNLKISICIILELLNMVGKGKSFNELTKICALIALITGSGKSYVLNTAQKGVTLSGDYHSAMIEEANKVLGELRLPFALCADTSYYLPLIHEFYINYPPFGHPFKNLKGDPSGFAVHPFNKLKGNVNRFFSDTFPVFGG
jgi:hypothetical protein